MPLRSFFPTCQNRSKIGLQHRRRDSHPGVADAEPEHASASRSTRDADLALARRELDRVREEVGEDLEHPIVIEHGAKRAGRDLGREGDALLQRGGLEGVRRFRQQGGGVAFDGRHRRASRRRCW